jgi:hemoglobin/transferrin/lactoferrin receptor protein
MTRLLAWIFFAAIFGDRIALAQRPTLPEIEVRPPAAPSKDLPPAVKAPIDKSPQDNVPSTTSSTPSDLSIPNSTVVVPNEAVIAPPSEPDTVIAPLLSSVGEVPPPPRALSNTQGTQPPRYFPSSANQSPSAFDVGQRSANLETQMVGGSISDTVGLNNAFRNSTSLFESPQLATVIDRATLAQRQSSSMFRALQGEVGVLLQQTGNGQLSPFMRGLTGQQILVLVDGIRMNTSVLRAGPNQYTATIDPGMIERIEVVRGAESAIWGSDAIGGAINIVTRSADPKRGAHLSPHFSQYYSTAEASTYTRTGFGGWYGKTGVFGGVSYLDTGLLDRGGGLGRQPATDYEQFAGDLKLQRILGTNHILTVALQHFEQEDLKRSDRFLPFVLGPAPNGSISTQRPTFFDPQQRELGYVRLEGLVDDGIVLADAYSLTLTGSRVKEGSVVDRYSNNNVASLPTRRELGEFEDWGWGTIVAASKNVGDVGKLSYGSDFYGENIDSTRRQINNPTNPSSIPTVIDPQYPDDAQADRVGAFLSWNVLLTERLDITTSARYENTNLSGTPNFTGLGPLYFERTYQDWIGSVGLSYKVNNDFRLIGGVYEGFRAPTIDDLTANKTSIQNAQSIPLIGNLALQPEHSLTYEAGFKVDGDRWRLQVVEFWTKFDSYIGRQLISGTEFLTNQEAYIHGTELNSQYFLNRDVSLYGNAYYTYGEILTTNDFVPRIPPMQGILGMRYTQPKRHSFFDVYCWMVQRADRYNIANLTDVRFIRGGTPGYATLNVRTGRNFGVGNRHQVTLGLENITDKYYRVLGSGVDGAGFNAVFGYQYAY